MNTILLDKEISQNFIDFSHEANCQRAFADARDGLKPGQRACLWEMFVKGYTSSKPHVKSAKISGGTIASWWPHGDTAIYDTFARMSQSWINNLPEVDWHGANGSIQISGEPAASRYTEARLSKITEEGILYNIKKHNVPMKLNFSEDDEWPEVFPAIIPRLMINGCQGIGSTIANTWLPHNLNELTNIIVKYINDNEIDYNNIAPSFPSGGIIINKKDLPIIYKTGKGKVILRAKIHIESNIIKITEIPYQVYVEPLIEQIKELIKKDEIIGIINITNKSDKKHLLIEIECENNPSSVINQLYKKTNLQKNYNANQYALVGKTPQLLNLKDYLDIYIEHNLLCIKKENEYEINKAKKRLEIVLGLIKALEDIDNIINLIKKSNSVQDAIQQLIIKYNFTENQSKAIVEMKLGKLAKLEKIELNKEKESLTSTIESCNNIIQNISIQKEIFLDRLQKINKKYGDARRTELTQIDIKPEEKIIEEVIPEDVVVILSQTGDIKRVPVSSFKVQRKNGKGVKTKDDAILSTISTNTIDNLLLFSRKGKMFKMIVDDVPVGTNSSKGINVNTLIKIDADDEIIAITSLARSSTAKYVVFFTKNGLMKKTLLEEYTKVKRGTGIAAIKINEGDSIVNVEFLNEEQILVITKKGMAIRFESKLVNSIGRIAAGVKTIKLDDGDELIAGLPITSETDEVGIISTKGYGKKTSIKEFAIQGRAGKGIVIYKPTMVYGEIAIATIIKPTDNILLIGKPNSICISATELPLLSRTSFGNIMIKSNIQSGVKF